MLLVKHWSVSYKAGLKKNIKGTKAFRKELH